MKYTLMGPKPYIHEFKQLYKFIVSPTSTVNKQASIAQKIQGTWTMFVVKFLVAIVVGVAVGIFYDAENITKGSMAARFSLPVLALVSIAILPLLEEIAFRLSLKFKPIYLAFTVGTLTYYFLTKAIYHTKLSAIHDHFTERLLLALAMVLLSYVLASIPKVNDHLEMFWKRHFKSILYISCFSFAWMHIFNYELSITHLMLMPLITLDKLVSALCYSYARVRYGFISSLAIHMLNNGIGLLVAIAAGTV